MNAGAFLTVATAISCVLAALQTTPCNGSETAGHLQEAVVRILAYGGATEPSLGPQQASSGGGFDSCPPPNPAVRALVGHQYALRACVVCPMVAAPRAPCPVNPVTNRVEYFFQQASHYNTAMRNEASGPVRITEVSQMGDENDRQWLQPGEEFRALMLSGAWLRAYAATGALLLEHRVGVTPIVSANAFIWAPRSNGTDGVSLRSVPPKISKGWKARRKRFEFKKSWSHPRSVAIAFLNVAGHGVDVLESHSRGGESELVHMIPHEETRLHNVNPGHKFSFVDEAGRGMGEGFVVKDIVVRDCPQGTNAASAGGFSIGQELASAVPFFTFGSVGRLHLPVADTADFSER